MNKKQKIIVFEQNGKADAKIQGIKEYGNDLFDIKIVSMDTFFPPVIDDAREYFPSRIDADIVLDYLIHPDLSHDLGAICRQRNIPVVASGKKYRGGQIFTPPTCCGLVRHPVLGLYGKLFGAPEIQVLASNGEIQEARVLRGAPCGATWEACQKITGMRIEEATTRIGLETQFFCSADPSGWDPIYGKSPVHFAGHVHKAALKKACAAIA